MAAPVPMEASYGTHVFEVRNYSQHRDLCINSYLRSSTFHVGGCDWAIRFYPGGCFVKEDPSGSTPDVHSYIAVGLELTTMDATATVSLGVELVDEATGAQYTGIVSSKGVVDTRCVEEFAQTWCITGIMNWSELESSAFLRDYHIMIECNVRVLKGTMALEARPVAGVVVPPSDLPEHLGRMLDEGGRADITFEVQGESITAHIAVVASRSPIFKAELNGLTKDDNSEYRVPISDMQPNVFRALLHFIYTDSLPNMDDLSKDDHLEMIRHLLAAADRYAMDRLKLVCAQILSKNLDEESVSTTLGLADQHCCSALKDACIDYIIASNKMDGVAKTQGYRRLKTSCPFVLLEALEKAAKLRKI